MMTELTRSGDAVLVSWLEMRLGELGIKTVVLDTHTSSIYGGALAAVQRRIIVDQGDLDRSRDVLAEAASEGDL